MIMVMVIMVYNSDNGDNGKHTLTNFSESPRYLAVRVVAVTLKKVVPHSVATALASMVFPIKNY